MLEGDISNDLGISLNGEGSKEVNFVKYDKGNVYINRTQYFSGLNESL